MAGRSTKSDRNKKIILLLLFFLLMVVMMRQLFFSGSGTRPAGKGPDAAGQARSGNAGQAPVPPGRTSVSPTSKQAQLELLLADITPLGFVASASVNGNVEVKRNVFAYYVKPPDPPPPPPPPPPIAVRFVQPQTAVAGTPKAFRLTVTGEAFPPDAQIIFGGRVKPTKRLSDKQLVTDLNPADYVSSGTVNVEVKSAGDPVKLFSNPVAFVTQAAPEPPFKFVGLIGDLGVFEVTGQGGLKEHVRLRRGQMIDGVWRIDSISAVAVEVTDTRYDIKKRISL